MKKIVVGVTLLAACATLLTTIATTEWWASTGNWIGIYLSAHHYYREYERLNKQNKELKDVAERLEQERQELARKVVILQQEVAGLQAEILSLSNHVGELTERVELLTSEKTSLEGQVSDLSSQISDLTDEITTLGDENRRLSNGNRTLEEVLSRIRQTEGSLRTVIREQQEETRELRQVISVGGDIEAIRSLWRLLGRGSFVNVQAVEDGYMLILNTLVLRLSCPDRFREQTAFEIIGVVCPDSRFDPLFVQLEPAYNQPDCPFSKSERMKIESGQSYLAVVLEVLPDGSYAPLSLQQLQRMQQSGTIVRDEASDFHETIMFMFSAFLEMEIDYLWGFRVTRDGQLELIE